MKLKSLYKSTVISLVGKVDEAMIKALDDGLAKAREKNQPVTIQLSSTGGEVNAGHAIAQRICLARKAGTDITMIGVSYVSSSAVTIFLSVPHEKRFVTADCHIMVHPARKAFNKLEQNVSLDELVERLEEELGHARHAKKLEESIISKLCRITKIPRKKFMKMYRRSHRFDAKMAVRYNLASAIIR